MSFSVTITRFVLFLAIIMSGSTLSASSQARYTMTVEAEFDDVFFDLKEQIIGKGLVVEHIGHVGKMLERTSVAVIGSNNNHIKTYKFAKYLQFCSATLTHHASGKDAANLSICPFVLYAYETTKQPGKVTIGYRNPDFGDMDQSDPLFTKIHAFLKQLVDDIVADY